MHTNQCPPVLLDGAPYAFGAFITAPASRCRSASHLFIRALLASASVWADATGYAQTPKAGNTQMNDWRASSDLVSALIGRKANASETAVRVEQWHAASGPISEVIVANVATASQTEGAERLMHALDAIAALSGSQGSAGSRPAVDQTSGRY